MSLKQLSPLDLSNNRISNVADAEAQTDALTRQVLERGQRELGRWHAALANAANKPADLAWFGDSNTEGYRASSDLTRFQNLVTTELQKVFNPVTVPGGEGYIPVHHTVDPAATTGNLANRWTYVGLPGVPTNVLYSGAFGLGRRYLNMTTTAQYVEITVWCDRFWLHFSRGTGTGNAVISIDGSVITTFDTYRATGGIDSYAWDSGALTRGFHTIRVTPSTGSTGGTSVYIEGIMVFDGDGGNAYNVGAGVRSWDAGSYGSTSVDWSGTDYPYRPLTNVRPDLVMVGMIANDAIAATALVVYEADLGYMIDEIRWFGGGFNGEQNPSICIWVPNRPATVTQAVWDTYVAVAQRVARTKGVAFLDLSALGFPTSTQSPELYAADGLHYSDQGMYEQARVFTAYLGGTWGVIKKQNNKGTVVHGSNASVPRPSGFSSIEWQGSVTPTNAIDGDTWIDTT